MKFGFFKCSKKFTQQTRAWNVRSHLLNLGCGAHFHPAWMNVDAVPASLDVMPHDLCDPLPFADGSFSAVYHSHVLEHFPRAFAPVFLAECHRMLKIGGILRVAVPDLEKIACLYLETLREALSGNEQADLRHEWMTIELLDQMTREETGGEMLKFWSRRPMPAKEFVIQRTGQEVLRFIQTLEQQIPAPQAPSKPAKPSAVEVAQFRESGEIHKWMYDRFSLARILRSAGFAGCKLCAADESSIPDFNSYRLDVCENGSARKPDSIFMEAVKP